MIPESRLAIIAVSVRDMMDALLGIKIIGGFPLDAEILRVGYALHRNSIEFVLRHKSFDEVPDGQIAPVVQHWIEVVGYNDNPARGVMSLRTQQAANILGPLAKKLRDGGYDVEFVAEKTDDLNRGGGSLRLSIILKDTPELVEEVRK